MKIFIRSIIIIMVISFLAIFAGLTYRDVDFNDYIKLFSFIFVDAFMLGIGVGFIDLGFDMTKDI